MSLRDKRMELKVSNEKTVFLIYSMLQSLVSQTPQV